MFDLRGKGSQEVSGGRPVREEDGVAQAAQKKEASYSLQEIGEEGSKNQEGKMINPEDDILQGQFEAYVLATRGKMPDKYELVSFQNGDDPMLLQSGGFVHRETVKRWSETNIKRF